MFSGTQSLQHLSHHCASGTTTSSEFPTHTHTHTAKAVEPIWPGHFCSRFCADFREPVAVQIVSGLHEKRGIETTLTSHELWASRGKLTYRSGTSFLKERHVGL